MIRIPHHHRVSIQKYEEKKIKHIFNMKCDTTRIFDVIAMTYIFIDDKCKIIIRHFDLTERKKI